MTIFRPRYPRSNNRIKDCITNPSLRTKSWYRIDSAATLLDITKLKTSNAVSDNEIDGLDFHVWIDEPEGTIANLLDVDGICKQIEAQQEKKERLEEQIESVLALGDNQLVASLSMQKQSAEVTIDFWQAILAGDAEQAKANMAAINHPDRLRQKMREQALDVFDEEKRGLEEALSEALAQGDIESAQRLEHQLQEMNAVLESVPLPLDDEAASDALSEQANQLAQAAWQALDAGETDAALELALEAVANDVQAEMVSSGLTAEMKRARSFTRSAERVAEQR